MVSFSFRQFLRYVLDEKLSTEYSKVLYMARLYENELERSASDADKAAGTNLSGAVTDSSENDIYKPLDEAGRDYIITYASGKIIHVKGYDTRKINTVKARITETSDEMELFIDQVNPYFYKDRNGMITIDSKLFLELLNGKGAIDSEIDRIDDNMNISIRDSFLQGYNMGKQAAEGGLPADGNGDDPGEAGSGKADDSSFWQGLSDGWNADESGNIEIGVIRETEDGEGVRYRDGLISYQVYNDGRDSESFVDLPLWMSVDIMGGDRKLIVQTLFDISIRELMLFAKIASVIIFLVSLVLLVMLINAIRGMIRQKKITGYFFSEATTGGNNWTWYLIKGNQLLKKRTNRRYNYAVISLLFVNYRTYCVCHSLTEGEKMLKRVYVGLSNLISKKEMCAYAGYANFALILRYEQEEELKTRLNSMIRQLEFTDPDHKFNFQFGVSLIGKNLDAAGKPVRRKDIELENEYNNATAARLTMSETEESGIAFFDERIVEDQKWLDTVQEHQKQAVSNEEFMVYYQPKYDPRTNELRGAEALIRWNSPQYGLVAPYKFIPIFEKNGFITEIDHYMIQHVARAQKKWLDAGYKCVPVSVNVSRAHFIESDLAEQIRDMIDEAGCPHHLIEIELTESAFFDDKKAMITTINKLKEYGFAVSMDDFGAGYSSLNSLKEMPLDVLKLDAEFFRGEAAEEGRGEIVVSEAIKLAKSLNMRIVAEGVEIKEQVDFLASEGCDMIQGYYFAKPMPGAEYEQKMSTAA